MLFLYHHHSSVCAAKVRIDLAEKDLTWDGKMLDLNAGISSTGLHQAQPKSVVPTLIHDDRVIIEANVIVEYLDDAFAEPALRPTAAYNRARMRLWLQRLDNGSSGIHLAASHINFGASYRYQLMELFGDDPADLDRAVTAGATRDNELWGHVAGASAGRERYERIKARDSFAHVIDHYGPEFAEVLSETWTRVMARGQTYSRRQLTMFTAVSPRCPQVY